MKTFAGVQECIWGGGNSKNALPSIECISPPSKVHVNTWAMFLHQIAWKYTPSGKSPPDTEVQRMYSCLGLAPSLNATTSSTFHETCLITRMRFHSQPALGASPMQPHRHRNKFTPCESQTCAQQKKSARPRSRKNQLPTRTQNAELHNQIRSKSSHRHNTEKRTPHGKNSQSLGPQRFCKQGCALSVP